jgi:hypothetical protein
VLGDGSVQEPAQVGQSSIGMGNDYRGLLAYEIIHG